VRTGRRTAGLLVSATRRASRTAVALDAIINQAYTHKMLTGRRAGFDTLRQYGGLSGFTSRAESEHDPFGAGHASTSISAALGMACARDLDGKKHQVIADGSESNVAIAGLNYAAMIVGRYSGGVLLERLQRSGLALRPVAADVRSRVWYNPELKSRNFMVPGILAQLLLLMTMLLTSLAVVKEKETGTLEQLIVTPLTSLELILGKLLPFVLIGFLDTGLVLGVAWLLFGLMVSHSSHMARGASETPARKKTA
jgi:hypothetical protein